MILSFEHHGRLESTNDYIIHRLRTGRVREGFVVTADEQTQGRGRNRQEWHSPQGNLHSSLLLKPLVAQSLWSQLALVTALAVCLVLEKLKASPPLIKWPNDILINNKKMGGCLIEGCLESYVVIGVGLNIAHYPSNAVWPATSMESEGYPSVEPLALAKEIWGEMVRLYGVWLRGGLAVFRHEIEQRLFGQGEPWTCIHDRQRQEGTFIGIDPQGAFLLLPEGDTTPLTLYTAHELRPKSEA